MRPISRAAFRCLGALVALAVVACDKADKPAATAVVAVSGNRQEGLVGTALAQPLVVQVSDQYGNPVANATVTFAVTAGGGSVAPATATTTANGQASAAWTLGTSVGTQGVSASAAGTKITAPVEFTAIAVDQAITGVVTLAPQGELAELGMGPARTTGALRTPDQPSAASRLDHVPGELLVTFEEEAVMPAFAMAKVDTREEAEPVAAHLRQMARAMIPELSVAVVRASAPLRYVVVRAASDAEALALMQRLRADPRVESVEWNEVIHRPDYQQAPLEPLKPGAGYGAASAPAMRAAGSALMPPPTDPLRTNQAWHYEMIDFYRAWERQQGAAAVTVAVIDDGSVPNHPDMAGVYTADGYNFVAFEPPINDFPPCVAGTVVRNSVDGRGPDPRKQNDWALDNVNRCWRASTSAGHGLHVAGTIAAVANNGVGGHGIAAGVRIRPIRVFGDKTSLYGGTTDDIAQAVLYAAGLPATGAGNAPVQGPRTTLVNMSLGGGASTVIRNAVTAAQAAGSLIIASAGNSSTTASSFPAGYPGVVSVTALGPDGDLARYSNAGSAAAIAAPGGDFFWNLSSGGVLSTVWNFVNQTPNYAYFQGTSMAAPHVTGVAALLLSAEPTLGAAAIRDRLLQFALPTLGPVVRSDLFGFGFLNAAAALSRSRTRGERTQLRLVNAATGDTVRTLAVTPGTPFSLGRVPDGRYWLVAAQDQDNDGAFGAPGRRFGAAGSASAPREITIGNRAGATANIQLGYNVEAEPNDSLTTASRLYVNSSVAARFDLPDPNDTYVIQIPRAGTYVFETGPVMGACGLGMEVDTNLQLLSSTGTPVASNDDINLQGGNLCSRVSQALQPGTYYVRVTNSPGQIPRWRYRLTVRAQ